MYSNSYERRNITVQLSYKTQTVQIINMCWLGIQSSLIFACKNISNLSKTKMKNNKHIRIYVRTVTVIVAVRQRERERERAVVVGRAN